MSKLSVTVFILSVFVFYGCRPTEQPAVPLVSVAADSPAVPQESLASVSQIETAAVSCGDVVQLRAEALSNGEKVLNGLTLKASTPIGAINAAHEQYVGKLVQIEGKVTGVCQGAGCWVALTDAEGNTLKLKVHDGAVDFRQVAAVGRYMVGEGIFTPTGNHGAQVHIGDHGARVGSFVCR